MYKAVDPRASALASVVPQTNRLRHPFAQNKVRPLACVREKGSKHRQHSEAAVVQCLLLRLLTIILGIHPKASIKPVSMAESPAIAQALPIGLLAVPAFGLGAAGAVCSFERRMRASQRQRDLLSSYEVPPSLV